MVDTTQVVKAGKSVSSSIEVLVGVPQGGPMSGPIFTCDTNDITSDDTRKAVIVRHRTDNDVYKRSVPDIVSTSQNKNLLLNTNKFGIN